jgi:2-hydroxy-3-oxopropionate reductase
MNLGWIGLGIMGTPMCGHLMAAGHTMTVNTRSEVPAAVSAAGAHKAASAREVAERSDVVFLMLPDTPDVERVLFGETGVASGLTAGKLVIDMSSISPLATRSFAERIAALGCEYLDAPVSGGEVGARAATLSIMCGGSAAAFERARPLLAAMGKNITHVGASGAGQTAKVANQIVVALTIEAVAEALVFAQRAGADPAKVREALLGGFANSRVLDVHGLRMVERRFEPGFRIALHQKDLALALDSARSLGMALPNTAATQQLFGACLGQGGQGWDHSALVKAIERLAGVELGAAPVSAAG